MTQQTPIQELRKQILRHDRLYYTLDQPEISDAGYDQLMNELKEQEREQPHLITPDSPTQRVGAEVSANFPQVDHPVAMLSLGNAFGEDDFRAWHNRMAERVGHSNFPMNLELKIDGLAVRVLYENGALVLGATRGNGSTGEDVTHTVRTVRNLPLTLSGEPVPQRVEARGEVYMPRSAFQLVNQEREEQGEYTYANPRNAAAGALRQLHPETAARRRLLIWLYSAQTPAEGVDSHHESLYDLLELGLPINPVNRLVHTPEEVISFYRDMTQGRDGLDYEVDGVVVKMDLFAHQEMLGATNHEPRWAVAWKFPPQQARTRLVSVQISHGRFGRLTPVAVLEPVRVAGVTVTSASLHNQDDMRRKDIRVGDTVVIERAGDVIPQVTGPVDPDPARSTPVFEMPENCPACDTPTHSPEGEVGHWCINDMCPSRLPEQLRHFVSKKAMNIENVGDHWCSALIEKGLVRDPSDLYQLTERQLLSMDRMGARGAARILKNIDASRSRPLDRVVYSLGIFRLGREVSTLLAARYQSVLEISQLDEDELSAIDGIGPKIARSVVQGFKSERVRNTTEGLARGGVRMDQPPPANKQHRDQINGEEHMTTTPKGNPHFAGKTFVVTGKITDMTRVEAEALIVSAGGVTASSVTAKTNCLIVGEKPGSKLAKARKLGIDVVEEHEFFQLLNA